MWKLLVCLVVLGALIAFFPVLQRHLPPGYDPFSPLSVDDPPTFITRIKLKQLADDPAACLAVLRQAQDQGRITFSLPGDIDGQCPLSSPVRVQRFGDVTLGSSFLASCPLALSSTMFVTQSAIPQAQRLGAALSRIDHLGSYACRNIYHRPEGRLSEHATADAWDIAGFRLADGRRISVLNQWKATDETGDYLRTTFEQSCGFFGNSLGPEYNAAHANHFHLGMRGFGVCR
ncbi:MULTISPECIES: extensin-like domain-containing protein [unclassified Brenneria]|uniref:extensin-like domain-containing protein n=1 Tax=unclassified Brenneria TaxID=2634434 RepID=UPI0015533FA2|nr:MULTISPECIES: extensin family protein [unclassified Brenneria]MBJ7220621.1 extensin family protein [Brenneria sp. L3-3C-1]MEE3641864.1 extensin family protein [Brenneria sp. L3_3C_1]MEE3649439.1 extensin family protein [Brenneria sp. HEZEL_4_2_4]NPC99395.1 extensin family protein [Brenneria sp. hezel4-2-4]